MHFKQYNVSVTGNVTYLSEKHERVLIPKVECEVIEETLMGPFLIFWREDGMQKQASLSLQDWGFYQGQNAFRDAHQGL